MNRPSTPRLAAGAVAIATGGLLANLAARGGGYDVVDRQSTLVVLWWLTGLAALILPDGPRAPRASGIAATAFGIGIALWISIDIGSSLSTERSAIELARATGHVAPLILIGWVMPAHAWRSVTVGAILGAVGICLAAFGDRLSPGLLGQAPTVVFANSSARLTNPMGYWNAVGCWCVMTSLLLLAVATHAPSRVARALAMAPLPMIVVTAYLTFSRSAIAGLALGVFVLFVLARNRWTFAAAFLATALAGGVAIAVVEGTPEIRAATGGGGASGVLLATVLGGLALASVGALSGAIDGVRMGLKPARIVATGCAVIAVVIGVVGVATYGSDAWDSFNTPEQGMEEASSARLTSLNTTRATQWRIAIDQFKREPLHGSGAGTFEIVNNRYTPNGEFVRDAHNAFIEALGEQGLPGFLLLLGFVGSGISIVAAALRAAAPGLDRGLVAGAGAALATFTFGTAIDWFWEVTGLAMLALVLLAALIAAGREAKPGGAAPARRRTWPLRVAIVALSLVAVAVQLPGLVGTSEIRKSQRAVSAGDFQAARDDAGQAIETMPWASSPFLQRALVDERAGAFAASIDGLHLAIERDPYDWRLPLVLARVEAKAGHRAEAVAAYRQAKRLRPTGQFFR